jgi:hypothetical protein
MDAEDLVSAMGGTEERLYRHRCVEAWAMAVPWSGVPLANLMKVAKPTSGAKYLRMETFLDPKVAPGQKQAWYPWPYVEGLTIEEAQNDCPLNLHRRAPSQLLGRARHQGIRLLGECESGHSAPALAAEDGAHARHRRTRADDDLQRLSLSGGRALRQSRHHRPARAVLLGGVSAPAASTILRSGRPSRPAVRTTRSGWCRPTARCGCRRTYCRERRGCVLPRRWGWRRWRSARG